MSNYKYPVVLRGTRSGVIVRFTADKVGTVIGTGHSRHKIGYYSDGWAMGLMEPYEPKLVETKG